MSHHHKISVVTGGAGGIGRCLNEALLKAGAVVACIDTDSAAGRWLEEQYGTERLFFYAGDIAQQSVLDDFTAQVISRYGQVDYLINNACISPGWIDTTAYHGIGESAEPVHTEPDRLQHPAGRVGIPADIAAMVLFLCSEAAGFITGENITIDGGMSKQMIYHGDEGWTYHPGGQS